MKSFKLLTAILLLFLQSDPANTHPTRPIGFISIPISKVPESKSSNTHPAIVHQQHANRGIQRLALMSGRAGLSRSELLSSIQRRLSPELQKRYNHAGIAGILDPQGRAKSANTVSWSHEVVTYKAGYIEAAQNIASSEGGITKAQTPEFDDSVGLDIQSNDVGYLATLYLGTPPRAFQLLVDSGSADLWVGAEDCQDSTNPGDCGQHTFLGPSSSSSFNDTKEAWSITYGSGDVSGRIVHDNVRIAGLMLKAHKFGVASGESEDFTPDDVPFDGLLGMARSKISQQRTLTLVESLHAAGFIPAAIASYKIPRLVDGKNDGELTLGAMDPSKFIAKSLVTVKNVNQRGFWEATIGTVKVNGKDMGWKNRTAILDTGTTLLIAPAEDVNAIHNSIIGAKFQDDGWTVPCTTNVTFSLSFGGKAFSIDARDIAFLPVNQDDPAGDCMSGISIGFVGPSTEWLVGDVFLKNVYLSTNANQGRGEISIAKLAI